MEDENRKLKFGLENIPKTDYEESYWFNKA